MTLLAHYLTSAGQPDIFGSGGRDRSAFDEFVAEDGRARPGWQSLLGGLADLDRAGLTRAQREVARQLQDDAVTYTPSPEGPLGDGPASPQELSDPTPWLLDPMPWVLDAWEWATLEIGLVQRAELLNAVLADLYGERALLAEGALPPEILFAHPEYVRAAVGIGPLPLFMTGTDLGRDTSGEWRVRSDRTQAPSGAGYAMQNRRVISRALPGLYQQAHLHRLTPFFQSMRMALADAAPSQVEDPRVVVLTPGTHSETAFDQAFLASLLGYPLLEGNDLTVRDGKVFMCGLGREEQVDVIVRRVDTAWSDPLELRPDSRLGVPGLLECVRQGSVAVANPLGSGVLENPGLLPFLPDLCERLLGEPLRLPSVETFWCGDPVARDHVLTHLDQMVVRPIAQGSSPSVRGDQLTRAQLDTWRARIEAHPHSYVGQPRMTWSTAPSAQGDQLVPHPVALRSFTVRSGTSYAAMAGGLGMSGASGDTDGVAKDVWVVASEGEPAPIGWLPERRPVVAGHAAAMVPRVLSDLFWFGRYAERAEDLLRLVLAARQVATETDGDRTPGQPLDSVLRAITHVGSAYPGFLAPGVAVQPELRAMLLDRRRSGTVAQSVAALTNAGQGVRDQLSQDVWMVLAGVDRALAALSAAPDDRGAQLFDTSERVLSGLLGLAGITSENMVRDAGWHLMDAGRGLERALQVLALLRSTICRPHDDSADQMIIEAALSAAESIVTYRRRYRGQARVATVVELLILDPDNPRSVAYQVDRLALDLAALPNATNTTRSMRIIDDLRMSLVEANVTELAMDGLLGFLGDLQEQFKGLASAVSEQYLQLPPQPRPLWQGVGQAS